MNGCRKKSRMISNLQKRQKKSNSWSIVNDIKANTSFYVTIGIILILLSSYFYNIGFMSMINWKFITFLGLVDYYETLPLITSILLLVFIPLSLVYFYLSNRQYQSFLEAIKIKFDTFKILCEMYIVKLMFYKMKRKHNKYRKKYIEKLKICATRITDKENVLEYNDLIKFIKSNYKEMGLRLILLREKYKKAVLKVNRNLISEIFAFLFCFAFFIIGILNYIPSKVTIFIILCAIILFALFFNIFNNLDVKFKAFFHLFFILFSFFILGQVELQRTVAYGNTLVEMKSENKKLCLIRKVSSGAIVIDKKLIIYFLPNNDIKNIQMQLEKE